MQCNVPALDSWVIRPDMDTPPTRTSQDLRGLFCTAMRAQSSSVHCVLDLLETIPGRRLRTVCSRPEKDRESVEG